MTQRDPAPIILSLNADEFKAFTTAASFGAALIVAAEPADLTPILSRSGIPLQFAAVLETALNALTYERWNALQDRVVHLGELAGLQALALNRPPADTSDPWRPKNETEPS